MAVLETAVLPIKLWTQNNVQLFLHLFVPHVFLEYRVILFQFNLPLHRFLILPRPVRVAGFFVH